MMKERNFILLLILYTNRVLLCTFLLKSEDVFAINLVIIKYFSEVLHNKLTHETQLYTTPSKVSMANYYLTKFCSRKCMLFFCKV